MGRPAYVIRRLLQAVPVVFAILILNFLLLHLAPGDAAQVLAGEAGSATPEYMAQLRQRFGLDRSLAVQLVLYVKQMLALDLGFSFRHSMPVLDLILARLGPTLLLMLTTLGLSASAGITLGLLAAARWCIASASAWPLARTISFLAVPWRRVASAWPAGSFARRCP